MYCRSDQKYCQSCFLRAENYCTLLCDFIPKLEFYTGWRHELDEGEVNMGERAWIYRMLDDYQEHDLHEQNVDTIINCETYYLSKNVT